MHDKGIGHLNYLKSSITVLLSGVLSFLYIHPRYSCLQDRQIQNLEGLVHSVKILFFHLAGNLLLLLDCKNIFQIPKERVHYDIYLVGFGIIYPTPCQKKHPRIVKSPI